MNTQIRLRGTLLVAVVCSLIAAAGCSHAPGREQPRPVERTAPPTLSELLGLATPTAAVTGDARVGGQRGPDTPGSTPASGDSISRASLLLAGLVGAVLGGAAAGTIVGVLTRRRTAALATENTRLLRVAEATAQAEALSADGTRLRQLTDVLVEALAAAGWVTIDRDAAGTITAVTLTDPPGHGDSGPGASHRPRGNGTDPTGVPPGQAEQGHC